MAVAVVGCGIAGLHLALQLQQGGVDVHLYGDRDPQQLRDGPMLNTVARFLHTRKREEALGLEPLPARTTAVRLHIHTNPALGNPSLEFRGRTEGALSFVDMRIVQAAALETYLARGGDFRLGTVSNDDIAALAETADLVVVAAGRRGLDELLTVNASRSPFDQPQRRLTAMFLDGLESLPDADFGYHIVPGVGEVFHPSFTTAAGDTTALLFEGIPGTPFAQLADLDYATDPELFDKNVLALLDQFTPGIAELADRSRFSVRGPRDVLRGALTPRVRNAVTALPSGRCALAIGDAWITNDPVTGQGANTASHCAAVTARAILAGGPYDEAFCQRVEDEMWAFAGPVTEWTNATLGPPPDHVLGVFAAAAADPRVADALIGNFNDPPAMWSALSSPSGATAFVESATTSADTLGLQLA